MAIESNDRIDHATDRLVEAQRVIVRRGDIPEGVSRCPLDPMTYVI